MDGSRVTKDRTKTLRRTMSLPEVLLWLAEKPAAQALGPHANRPAVRAERLNICDGWKAEFRPAF
jgi:hypothetical protein